MFVGVGAARVRDLFEGAQAQAPCIVFIDELDALGRTRGGNAMGSNEEREQTLNQLLVEMDGFETNNGVIVLAATNRPEILDAALLRPGRFDRQVLVDRPDRSGRLAILKVHARTVSLAPDVDLETTAAETTGYAGADLANLINEAALLAARRGASAATEADLQEAMERVAAGLERRSRVLTPDERRRVAYHELGHALVGEVLGGASRVTKVSSVPRGLGALG
jgi:cell division protease FtsH